MDATFWSSTDPSDGVIAAGFGVAVGAVTRSRGARSRDGLVEKRLVIPGLAYAYSAASQGRGGWYNGVSAPVLVRPRTRFIGESVDTGYAPVGVGSLDVAEAIEAAGADWWASVAALPPSERTPGRCVYCALAAGHRHGVGPEVAQGLSEMIGAGQVLALSGEVPPAPTDPQAVAKARADFVAEGGDASYFDAWMTYMADSRQTAADLLKSAGGGVLSAQDRMYTFLERIAKDSYETERQREKEAAETERAATREREETWRAGLGEAGQTTRAVSTDVTEIPKVALHEGGQTGRKGADDLTLMFIVAAVAAVGITYYVTTSDTKKAKHHAAAKHTVAHHGGGLGYVR
jgi:hypothetical protein